MSDENDRKSGKFPIDLASKHEFLVSGDDHDPHWRIIGADDGLGGAAGGVFRRIETDAEGFEIGTNGSAGIRIVFANASGENQGVEASEIDEERADPVTDGMHVGVDGELRIGVPFGGSLLNVAGIVGNTG